MYLLRLLICDSLLKRNEIEPLLKRLITGDGRTTIRTCEKRSWSKGGQAPQTMAKSRCNKVMGSEQLLSLEKNYRFGTLLPQLIRFKQEIEKKQPKLITRKAVVNHHDNVRPHTHI